MRGEDVVEQLIGVPDNYAIIIIIMGQNDMAGRGILGKMPAPRAPPAEGNRRRSRAGIFPRSPRAACHFDIISQKFRFHFGETHNARPRAGIKPIMPALGQAL